MLGSDAGVEQEADLERKAKSCTASTSSAPERMSRDAAGTVHEVIARDHKPGAETAGLLGEWCDHLAGALDERADARLLRQAVGVRQRGQNT